MSDPQQLERELREYLEKEPNLRRDERISYLKTIFNKHLEITKLEHVINSKDLYDIIGMAKSNYTNFRLPLHVTRRRVDTGELPQVAMVESVLSYLSKMNLLKKLVKFDYTE